MLGSRNHFCGINLSIAHCLRTWSEPGHVWAVGAGWGGSRGPHPLTGPLLGGQTRRGLGSLAEVGARVSLGAGEAAVIQTWRGRAGLLEKGESAWG